MSEGISHFFRADLDPRDEKIRRLEAQNKLMRETLRTACYCTLLRKVGYEVKKCHVCVAMEKIQELEK